MKNIVLTDDRKCQGCNRCVRVCPVDEANITYLEDGQIKVRIDPQKCIACGACLSVCQHGARHYSDDTERFFYDLRNGEKIALIVAPAFKTNFENWPSILAWLRTQGVSLIADVSFGADICTWAHIRYIQQNNPRTLITQPCPAIVGYIEKYRPELIPSLSPVHSPMLCTAVYMKKYLNTPHKIAALSPCVAKTNEFDETQLVNYNVTYKCLSNFITDNYISIPEADIAFDHIDASLGAVYSMPGGLKENVEHYLGKKLRVDKSEGQSIVYRHIDDFAKEREENLPVLFDVLNCPDGCNLGTGCVHDHSIFRINAIMNEQRQQALKKYDKPDDQAADTLFELFDGSLRVSDFIRKYQRHPVREIGCTEADVEKAFILLGKVTETQRTHNCYACGNETCRDMAIKIAKGINIPENCIEKSRQDMLREHQALVREQSGSVDKINHISAEIEDIRRLFNTVLSGVEKMADTIGRYDTMTKLINDISLQTSILSINASIEAANSGSAGKGFAVIAQAVRDLAAKSRQSISNVEGTRNDAKVMIDLIAKASTDVEKSISTVSSYIEEITATMNGAGNGELIKQ
jgi:iron only hydrogenase large subunit-like protein